MIFSQGLDNPIGLAKVPRGGPSPRKTDALPDVLELMRKSPFHRTWSQGDIKRLIIPPIQLGQFYLLHDDNDGKPDGFVTWAFLTPEAAKGYIDKTRKIQPEDWNAGDDLWVIDMVTPHGNMKVLRAEFVRRARKDKLPLPGKYIRRSKGRNVVYKTESLVDDDD